jgi:tRNA (guanine-N7-)-methyltransferase
MKPKDLKIPCSFEERKPILLEKLFYVPKHYFSHQKELFPLFEDKKIFLQDLPLHVEICSGNGEWISEKAKIYPERNWLAIEMDFDRARKIWAKIHNEKLNNLFVIFGEALTFLQNYLPDHCVNSFYVNFPDPWPKQKHAKHRLLTENFFQEISRILRNDGAFFLATDDLMTSETFIQMAFQQKGWKSSIEYPHYLLDLEDYGSSFFARLWKEKGKNLRYHQYQIHFFEKSEKALP